MKKLHVSALFYVLLIFTAQMSFGQTLRPFNSLPPLLYGDNKFEPDISAIETIAASAPNPVQVTLPVLFSGLTEIDVTIRYQSIYTDGFKVVSNLSNGEPLLISLSDYFTGTINGNPESNVVMGIDKQNRCFVYINNGTDACVIQYSDNDQAYELYQESTGPSPFTADDLAPNPDPQPTTVSSNDIDNMPATKCIGAYIEVTHDFYLYFSSSTQIVTNIINQAFASNASIYAREGIPFKISELYIWVTPDPYNATHIFTLLDQFVAARPIFNGNISQLIKKTQLVPGIAGVAYAGVRANCSQKEHSVTNYFDSTPTYPIYSDFIKTMAHEFGHTLGSPHTHDCSWQNGPIDNCAQPPNCSPGPPFPGTIMSYCGAFPFTNGFSRLPGNLIRETFLNFNPSCLYDGTPPPLDECPVPTNLVLSDFTYDEVTVSWSATSAGSYAVDYKKPGDIHPTTVFTNNTSVRLTGLTTCANYTVSVQSMCNLTGSHFLNATFQTPTPPSCKTGGESTSTGWIQSVTVNSTTITTGDNGGYHFQPCTYINVTPGNLCYLKLIPGVPQFLPDPVVYWRIWVDVDQDNTFGADELMYDSGPVSGNVIQNVVVPPIPFVTSGIPPKIRISMKDGGAPEPCEIFMNGETEDYAVRFVEPDYCFTHGMSDADKWIARVQLSTIDRSSGPSGGYERADSSFYTTLAQGTTYTLQVTSGHAGIDNRRMYYRAWIDYDADKVFETEEMVMERYIPQFLTTATQSFTVPASTFRGDVVMRISMKQHGYPEPCELYETGEVEDYILKLTDALRKGEVVQSEAPYGITSVYPSPAQHILNVDILSEDTHDIQLEISDLSGKIIHVTKSEVKEGTNKISINTAALAPGIYIIALKTVNLVLSQKKFVVIR